MASAKCNKKRNIDENVRDLTPRQHRSRKPTTIKAGRDEDVGCSRQDIDKLFGVSRPILLRYARRLLNGYGNGAEGGRVNLEAEDLVQETLLRLWRSSDSVPRVLGRFLSYAFTTLRRVWINEFKFVQRREPIHQPLHEWEIVYVVQGRSNVDVLLHTQEIFGALELAMEGFPPRKRLAFGLRHFQGWPQKAIGEAVGVSRSRVAHWLMETRKHLVKHHPHLRDLLSN